ncbi:hypothetical protein F183_A43160 [Bryobacterales bacterium F-183]|nr:hypothetical protein F183_A43160 [Bryobacterales bacterium F-183]
MTDTLIVYASALAGILLQNCNLLEWIGLAVLLATGKYLAGRYPHVVAEFLRIKPSYWRYLSAISVVPVASVTLFFIAGGVPNAAVPDEWSHLFLSETLLEGRFANPPAPRPVAFEAIHILPEPTRSSMYLFGPALWLAAGKLLFGNAFWGLALAGALLGAALLWGLESVVEPEWAWLGTMLFLLKAVCGGIWGMYWIQSYWGGIPGALAGVMVTAAVWRLAGSASPWLCGAVLGLGAGLLMNTRPFEGVALCVGLFPAVLLRVPVRRLMVASVPVMLILTATILLMRMHFAAVTGDPGKMPYTQNQQLYGWPMTLPWMPVGDPPPRHEDMKAYWDWERREHETPFLQNTARKLGVNWQHYIGAFLAIPLLLALRRWREVPALQVLTPLAAVVGAVALEQTGFPHYLSPASAAIAALVALGCRMWPARSPWLLAGLLLMFVMRAAAPTATTPSQAIASLCCRYDMGSERRKVAQELEGKAGKQLVFVPNTIQVGSNDFYPWVYNEPDLDRAKVVFARDLGVEQNQLLWREYFRDRETWLAAPGIALRRLQEGSGSGSLPANRQP